MKIARIPAGLLLLVLMLSAMAVAAEEEFLRLERSKQTDLDLRTTSIGAFGVQGDKVGHLDLSYIESMGNGDAVALDVGGGVSFGRDVRFFLGVGFLLGYNWDNSDLLSAYYPEVGVVSALTKSLGVVVTGKRFYSLYNDTEDEDVVMFGLLFGAR